MNRLLTKDNISDYLRTTRTTMGKSQKHMAKALGKSVGTIQNWESGYCSPTVIDIIDWFDVLGVNPLRAMLECIHPDYYKDISAEDDVDAIRKACVMWVNECASDSEIRKVAYNIFGRTGSSWSSQVNEICALNHLPINCRILIAEMIYSMYVFEEERGTLRGTEHVLPDMSNLNSAIEACKEAVKNNKQDYV